MAAAKITDEQKIEMQALRDQGLSLNKIGERFNTTGKTVHYWTTTPEGRGRKMHPPPPITDESAEMWRLYAEGKTYKQIAVMYKIGWQAVGERIRRFKSRVPDDTREVVTARELAIFDEMLTHLLEIIRNDKGYTTTADRINAIRAVFSRTEGISKLMGLSASDVLNERRVVIAERQADLLDQAFRAFVVLVGLDPDSPKIQGAMAQALSAIDTGEAA